MAEAEALATLLKGNPALLLNPALMSLNPQSLYAMQIAQLQMLSQQSATASALSPDAATAASLRMSAGLGELSSPTNPLAAVRKRKAEDSLAASMQDYPDPATAAALAAAGVLNLTSAGQRTSPTASPRLAESPLDLSGGVKKLDAAASPKIPKLDSASSALGAAWPFLNPLLAAGTLTPDMLTKFPGLAASLGGGLPPTAASLSSPSGLEASPRNPLERMSEIAKGGSAAAAAAALAANSSASRNDMSPSSAASPRLPAGSRPSAWQSQWLNRGPDSNKDIFRCVWCKESFSSLQSLTTHMKETKHFGGTIPPSPTLPPTSTSIPRPPIPSPQSASARPPSVSSQPPTATSSSSPTSGSASKQRDILKEQLPMPRKLVRGQDVWLGRGEQQTRDILKCMWCGESFRSLDLMTKHMQETKHYTKVISQEQLMSWKSPEGNSGSQNHVNAVLTCKVCEQAFSTLKELSDHMVKNNHYKQDDGSPGPRGAVAGPPRAESTSPRAGQPPPTLPSSIPPPHPGMGGPPPPAKEKRKKSLPVRKLLELERAQQELSGQMKPSDPAGRISCEKCGEKIVMHLFVEHIRQCVGPPLQRSPAAASSATSNAMADLSRLLAASAAGGASLPSLAASMASMGAAGAANRKSPSVSPPTSMIKPRLAVSPPSLLSHSKTESAAAAGGEEPKSILGSLEKMVQNNFGSKRKTPESNLSILQRLGIDEGVDYSKPLMDPMSAMGSMFRSPSQMAAAIAAATSAGGALPPGLIPPQFTSTSTRSNSSECSSPDRFRMTSGGPGGVADGGRPSSVKSESSVKSRSSPISVIPPPDAEVPLAASIVKSKAASSDAASKSGDENSPPPPPSVKSADDNKGKQESEDEDEAPPPAKRRTRSSSRKQESTENGKTEDDIEVDDGKVGTSSPKSPSSNKSPQPAGAASGDENANDTGNESENKPGATTEDDDEEPAPDPEDEGEEGKTSSSSSNSKKKNSHPLAALQMLCDKTEKGKGANGNNKGGAGGASSGNGSAFGPGSDPGAILAFSWACNQAVVNDSLLKCPFCDTPFISKGAYRHHLSKMHFVKEGGMAANPAETAKLLMASKAAAAAAGGDKSAASASAAFAAAAASMTTSAAAAASPEAKEENAQSKFQKYSQLAKQLSCGSSQN